jgi:predicted porin
MNKNIKLAVAGAILATASVANAGIIIPAGEWTVDIGGNVNAYSQWYKNNSGNSATVTSSAGVEVNTTKSTQYGNGNGLLPNFLSVSGSTRQNDLDVAFTISIQPGSSVRNPLETGPSGNDSGGLASTGGINNRQSFMTFGDKSWGSVKLGKDLGIFASDAILSDMTLLGVGASKAGSGNTSLGRIGWGYLYADWKSMMAYTTPNFNGFQATVGITSPFNTLNTMANTAAGLNSTTTTASGNSASPAYEGKASYSFAANDVTGKLWVSGISQRVNSFKVLNNASAVSNEDTVAYAGDIGATVNVAGFGLTGYYYSGSGIGTTGQFMDGFGVKSAGVLESRDSDGGYIQATYVLPTKTKIGASWGVSNLDRASGENTLTTAAVGSSGNLVKENSLWTIGVYHPLTKHLNLVAEWNNSRSENQAGQENKANSGNLGAILFF